jgi:hypothetical protein
MCDFKIFAICGAVLFGSISSARAATAPFMNLLEYRQELLRLKGPNDERCAMNLRIRPSLRSVVLKEGHNFDWLVSDRNYLKSQRTVDQEWVLKQQNSMMNERTRIETRLHILASGQSPWVSYQDTNLDRLNGYKFYPGFYPLAAFVSYQVGRPRMPWGKDRGFTFKVFFEFKNPQTDLTATLYREYSRKLSEAGFEGDSKIPVLPGWIRFTWNNIIVHATTLASAKTAESIGLNFFGKRLASYSRGVDVQSGLNSKEIIDWPHYLCSEDPSTLPADVSDFVQNK